MGSERGQASVEWTGLVLLVSAALAALIAVAPEVEGRSLGAVVAHRIACAARGDCHAAREEPAVPATVPSGAIPATLRRRAALGVRRAHRVAGAVARRAWIACLGYRRYRYEREHPARLTPFDRMPVRDGVEIADECLNPFGFLRERRGGP